MQNCENCKHEFELRKEEKISVAEFNGVNYRIPEKHWQFVQTNLSYYSEKKNDESICSQYKIESSEG